ncbi:MAG: DNA recombination protein RmuC [Acidobacteria bacterium]|nr:DNA recombination protein RmuC [Acidobacteriota bacterium]
MNAGAWLPILFVALGALALGAALAWLAARARISALAVQLAERERAAAAREALLADADRVLRESFEALAAQALRANNQSFLELAASRFGELKADAGQELEARRKAVEQLVAPIRETLAGIDGELKKTAEQRLVGAARLDEQLRQIAGAHGDLKAETQRLVRALRAPDVRGRWGEIQLQRVVELAGMLEYCDFVQQEVRDGDAGKLRPDMIVRLPGGKQIIVDAKTPLVGYLEAAEAADDATRDKRLAEHAAQVRMHLRKLGEKAYWNQFPETPEFVVMFLPGESFFAEALRHDPGLIEYGVDARVIPASPITLIALLRAVAYGWQQERLAANARQISELGRELHKRLDLLLEKFAAVGRSLGLAVQAYNDAVGSLEARFLPQARKLRELGVAAADELPELTHLERMPRELAEATGRDDTHREREEP